MTSSQLSEPFRALMADTRWRPFVVAGGGVLLFVVTLRSAWLCDDAFITFRAAWNLVHGYGLVSNPAERVQGFTNPLWTLLIAAMQVLPFDIYWIGVGTSLLCTVALVAVLARGQRSSWAVALCLVFLSSSVAFTTFSTGGLENALSHVLLAALCLEALRPEPRRWLVWLLAALIGVNRLDHLVMAIPLLTRELWRHFRRDPRPSARQLLRPVLVGLSPLLAWLSFATLYYGFPFPNTAYAKLTTAIDRWQLGAQGMTYLVDATVRDPIVPTVLLVMLVLGFALRRSASQAMPLVIGAALYVAYVVSVGGDFMSGRLLTAPYLVGAIVVSELLVMLGPGVCWVALPFVLIQHSKLFAPLPVDVGTLCGVPPSGVVDERACYVEHTGVAQNVRAKKYKTHPYFADGLKFKETTPLTVNNVVGMLGFAGGPRFHLVDEYGLTDAFLARIRYEPHDEWRIGHFPRPIPEGYLETLATSRNELRDPCLRQLWDDLAVATRAPIFESGRLMLIARMNLHRRVCSSPK